MSYQEFTDAYQKAALGYLISIPKAVRLLCAYKIQDRRFRSLLRKGIFSLFVVACSGICGFSLFPYLQTAGLFSAGICLIALMFWFEAGDILVQLASEDQAFFESATSCLALQIVVDSEEPLPQPEPFAKYDGELSSRVIA
jgi:hypothetical protein